jgi:hypothetical protein
VLFSGKLELILKDCSTVLQPGDTVVSQGTNHARRIAGDEPRTFYGMMIDGTQSKESQP